MSGNVESGSARRPRVIARPAVPPGPLAALKGLLYELYLQAGAPTLDRIADWVREDQDLAGAPGRDSVSRIIGDVATPGSQADVVAVAITLARAAGRDPDGTARRARDLWTAARMASARVPAAGIRASEADPRRLGVHAAISVPGVPDEILPEYVPRPGRRRTSRRGRLRLAVHGQDRLRPVPPMPYVPSDRRIRLASAFVATCAPASART